MNIRILAALAVLCGSSLFGATDADLLRDLRTPSLGSPVAVNNVTVTFGHLKLTLASGSAAKLSATGEPVGFFFKGTGRFEYVAEATEMPVVTRNVKTDSHTTLTGNTISGEVTEALVMFAGTAGPDLGTAPGGRPLADDFKAHQVVFDRAQIDSGRQLIAAKKLGPPGTAAYMEIVTPKDKLVYSYDAADLQEESLTSAHPPGTYVSDRKLAGYLFPTTLSSQPVGRDVRDYAKPLFTITALDYSLITDGDNAKLEMTETIAPRVAGQKAFRFNLDTELFTGDNKPSRHLHLASVADEQGKPLSFAHGGDNLLVMLPAAATQPFKVKFVIDGDFLIREEGDNAWQLVNFAWFPKSRNWAGNFFTVHSVIKVKKPFIPIAQGTTIVRKEEGDYNVVENVVDKPIAFPIVEGGKYHIVEEKRKDRTIRVAAYGIPNDRAAKTLTELAFGFIEYYEYFLGPFPWKEFNIIQINSYGYGQAPDATMFITNEAFNPLRGAGEAQPTLEQVYSQGINERFAHEIAHQYWGSAVKMPSAEEQWLTETFAEYSAALALKKFKGEGTYNRMVNTWRAQARQAAAMAPIPYANRIGGDRYLAYVTRTQLLYNKGPVLLAAIHKKLGDQQFLTFLKSYTKSFQGKFGTTNDVAGLLAFMTKEDWKPFFDQYYWGLAMPQ
ncbi:MAG: hypothetical protein QOC81_4304 [Thermoanaerobaculia bacterium]|jgi:hypothetical protein|nr:hypothetical protein [Thermoanaerobaculia bacterium]